MKRENDNEISLLGKIVIKIRSITARLKSKRFFASLFEREKRLALYDGPESSEESKLSYGLGISRIISVKTRLAFLVPAIGFIIIKAFFIVYDLLISALFIYINIYQKIYQGF